MARPQVTRPPHVRHVRDAITLALFTLRESAPPRDADREPANSVHNGGSAR
jgi:hypothetical protein